MSARLPKSAGGGKISVRGGYLYALLNGGYSCHAPGGKCLGEARTFAEAVALVAAGGGGS